LTFIFGTQAGWDSAVSVGLKVKVIGPGQKSGSNLLMRISSKVKVKMD